MVEEEEKVNILLVLKLSQLNNSVRTKQLEKFRDV
jgi:hypothetical protein